MCSKPPRLTGKGGHCRRCHSHPYSITLSWAPLFRTHSPAALIHPEASVQREFSNSRQEERPGTTKNIPSCVCKKEAPPKAAPGRSRRCRVSSHDRQRLFNSPLPRCLRPTRARALYATGQSRRAAVREPANLREAA